MPISKATTEYTFEEQFSEALATGISPRDMLVNVDARIDSTARNIADECKRSSSPDYAAQYVRKQAEIAIHLRGLRAYVLTKALETA